MGDSVITRTSKIPIKDQVIKYGDKLKKID